MPFVKKHLKIILLTILLVFIFFVILGLINRETKEDKSTISDTESSNVKPTSLPSDDTLSEENPSESDQPGTYTEYSEDKLDAAKKNVIFFAAAWCPSCRVLDNDITSNLDKIPSNVQILKADYDSETALKIKYKVNLQHTLVQVDGDGELVEKYNGLYSLYSLQDIINELE